MSGAQPAIQYASTAMGDIACRVFGAGHLDLVIASPMTRSVEMLWDYPANVELMERLASFSRVTVFDRRGSGISDPLAADLPPTWEDWLDDLLAVFEHVGIADAVLVAERDAAAASLLFASSHPERVRALVLCNTSARFRAAPGYPCGEGHARTEGLVQACERNWATDRLVVTSRPELSRDPEYRHWVSRMQRVAYSPRRAALEFRYIIDFDARSVLPAIRVPTLVLHRRGYEIVPPAQGRYLAEHIHGARFELLPGVDMDVLLPGDAQPVALVEQFLAGVQPAAAAERAFATLVCVRVGQSRETSRRAYEAPGRFLAVAHAELSHFAPRAACVRGDALIAAFDGPGRALRCAAAVRRTLREQLGLEIGIGLHSGECDRVGGSLEGSAVDVCVTVAAAADLGEVLVTDAVKALLQGSGLRVHGAGTRALPGLQGTWALSAYDE